MSICEVLFHYKNPAKRVVDQVYNIYFLGISI